MVHFWVFSKSSLTSNSSLFFLKIAQAGGEPGIFWVSFIFSPSSSALCHSATAPPKCFYLFELQRQLWRRQCDRLSRGVGGVHQRRDVDAGFRVANDDHVEPSKRWPAPDFCDILRVLVRQFLFQIWTHRSWISVSMAQRKVYSSLDGRTKLI